MKCPRCEKNQGMVELVDNKFTQKELKRQLHYNPDSGVFIWRIFKNGCVQRGDIAGTLNNEYIRIKIDSKNYSAHRLAWLYMYGEFPKKCIDHINRIKDDNRISNLRDVSLSINQRNRRLNKNNKAGYRGIYFNKKISKWIAQIKVNNVSTNLGGFKYKKDAIKKRKQIELKYNYK